MNERGLGALTPRAHKAASRRRSLVTLGATALIASVARPAAADVGKTSKKTKRIKLKKCKKQVGQCSAFLEEACLGNPVCEGNITCCGLFANCNATDALTCIFVG